MEEPNMVSCKREMYKKMKGTYDATARVYKIIGKDTMEIVDSSYCKVKFDAGETTDTYRSKEDSLRVLGFPIRLLSYFFLNNNSSFAFEEYKTAFKNEENTFNVRCSYWLTVWSATKEWCKALNIPWGINYPLSYQLESDASLSGTDINEAGKRYLPGVPVCSKKFEVNIEGKPVSFWFAFNGESGVYNENELSPLKRKCGSSYFANGIYLYPSTATADGKEFKLDNLRYCIFIRIYENKTDNE